MKHPSPHLHERALCALLALALCAAPVLAQAQEASRGTAVATFQDDPMVARIIELGLTDNRVHEHLGYLSKRIGPRLTGSTSLKRAQDWAVSQFRSWGLDARLERWGEFPVGFDRHAWSGGMVAPEQLEYVFNTYAWTAGTPGPVRGAAILSPAGLEEVEELGERLRGAWIVTLPRAERPKKSSVRREIDAAVDAYGIAGRVSKGRELLTTGGDHRQEFESLPVEVSVRLRGDQHEDLVERLKAGEEVELEFDIDNRFFPGPVPQYNVIAEIVGTEFPDEYVYVGGHLDSWDGAEGAQDNGTGVSTTMEAARLLAAVGAKPRRTIRFALWSGEEQGLLGSSAYVKQNPELLPNISAVLIHDMGTNYLSGISGTPALVDDLRMAFEPILDLNPDMPFEVGELPEGLRGGGSDHAPFLRAGVPGFFWRQSGETSYRYIHHTQHDTFENAREDYQRHSAIIVAVGAYNLARLDNLLDRTKLVAERRRGSRRRMGVFLDGNVISGVADDGRAQKAGWKEGDVIVSIDGVDVTSQRDITGAIRKGDPKKTFKLKRGEELVESVLDWSDLPSEIAKREANEKKAAEAAAKKEVEDERAEGQGKP